MHNAEAETRPPQPEDGPRQDVDSALPHPENKNPMTVPETPLSQDFSSPVIDGELNIFNDSEQSGQHDPNESFAYAESQACMC